MSIEILVFKTYGNYHLYVETKNPYTLNQGAVNMIFKNDGQLNGNNYP